MIQMILLLHFFVILLVLYLFIPCSIHMPLLLETCADYFNCLPLLPRELHMHELNGLLTRGKLVHSVEKVLQFLFYYFIFVFIFLKPSILFGLHLLARLLNSVITDRLVKWKVQLSHLPSSRGKEKWKNQKIKEELGAWMLNMVIIW